MSSVTSVNNRTGAIHLTEEDVQPITYSKLTGLPTSGPGISIVGGQINNTGVLGLVQGTGVTLTNNSGIWTISATGGGTGNVLVSGTPTSGQLAGWTNATTVQGITIGSGLTLTGTTLTANASSVISVTGTANQITVSPTIGAVIVSLPSTLVTPGSLQVTGNVGVGGLVNSTVGLFLTGTLNTSSAVGIQDSTNWTATGVGPRYISMRAGSGQINTGSIASISYQGLYVGTASLNGTSAGSTAYQLWIDQAPALATTWGLYQNGTDNNFFGGSIATTQLSLTGKLTSYNGISTAGWGVPTINNYTRLTAQTGALGPFASYLVGTSDGSFKISANVNVLSASSCNFTVICSYNDETNTFRTLTLGFTQLSGSTLITSITNSTGTGPYHSGSYRIRCKASSLIALATTGTFTTVSYNVEGAIVQVA